MTTMPADTEHKETFLQHLISSGQLRGSEAALLGRNAVDSYPEDLAALAVEKGLLTENAAAHSLADFYGHPYIDLETTTVDQSALAKIGVADAREMEILPFLLNGEELSVAMARVDLDKVDTLRTRTGCDILVHLASRTQIREAVSLHYPEIALSDIVKATNISAQLADAEESPVIKNVARALVLDAARLGASDIHVEPTAEVICVRLRVDGVLREEIRLPLEMLRPLVSRFKIMANLDIAETRRPQDGRITFATETRTIDLRVSFAPSIYGEKTVVRLLDRAGAMNDLKAMEFSMAVGERIERLITAPNGIILVTGPTGSGKSTTCYAVIQHLVSEETNIVTIEDPVECRVAGPTQIQVNHRIGLDFPTILRSVLRQDPDIILVGEIRDLETATIATQAALTGHLVISTLHTNNAVQAVVRLVEMGVDPFMVAPSLAGVLGQRLARRVCGGCKREIEPTEQDLALFKPYGAVPDRLFRGAGCVDCGTTGYRGRVGIHELVVVNDEIRQLILKNAPAPAIEAAAEKEGYRTMRYDALKKAVAGTTTTDEVRRVTTAREDFII